MSSDFEYSFPWEREPTREELMEYVENERVGWDSYFMNILREVSKQSPCLKKHVGAILVKDRRILASGYNGPSSGIPHCKSCIRVDEDMMNYSLCPAVHAEINCISMCSRFGISSNEAILYCEYFPCSDCCGALINSGINEIVYQKPPVDNIAMMLALRSGIKVRKWSE